MPKGKKTVKKKKKGKKLVKKKKVKAKKKTKTKHTTKFVYEGKDGYTIDKRWGDLDYFGPVLNRIIYKYGLSEPPDLEELLKVANRVLNHLRTSRFDDAIGYPVYPNSAYHSSLKRIARKIIGATTKQLEEGKYNKDEFREILSYADEEEWRWEWDMKTR